MYSMTESRFALIQASGIPDTTTMEHYMTPNGWNEVLSQIELQLCTMLERAQLWNTAVRDKASKHDIADLRLLVVQVEGLRQGDRTAELTRLLVHRMRVSVQYFFDNDLGVYHERAATVQSLVNGRAFR